MLNQTSLVTDARTVATKLKATGATTIVFTGDPIFPEFLTQQMTEQGYFPEWVMAGTVLADTNVFAASLRHQAVVARVRLAAHRPRACRSPSRTPTRCTSGGSGRSRRPQNNFALVKADVELVMDGIQLAGPKLTPQTFRDGMFHDPPQAPGPNALRDLVSYGNHGYWQGTDYNGLDNAGILYWDPSKVGPDETGSVGKGMYRLMNGGRRYLPDQWPTAPLKLFDPADTVTIYPADAIPPDLLPKKEPVPAGAGPTHEIWLRATPESPAAVGKPADDAGGHARDHGVIGYLDAGHDRARRDHHVLADARAGQHDRAVPEPAATADRDRLVLPHLRPDRQVEILVAVVLVGDVHVVTGPDVVADLDAFVADDPDPLAERAPVADRDHRIAPEAGLRRHARARGWRADRSRSRRRSRCGPHRRSPWAGSRSSTRHRTGRSASRAGGAARSHRTRAATLHADWITSPATRPASSRSTRERYG